MSDIVAAGLACSVVALLFLFPILKPDTAVRLTAQYFKWTMKLFGLEADVRPTPRARAICRRWNLFVLCIFLAAFLAAVATSK